MAEGQRNNRQKDISRVLREKLSRPRDGYSKSKVKSGTVVKVDRSYPSK